MDVGMWSLPSHQNLPELVYCTIEEIDRVTLSQKIRSFTEHNIRLSEIFPPRHTPSSMPIPFTSKDCPKTPRRRALPPYAVQIANAPRFQRQPGFAESMLVRRIVKVLGDVHKNYHGPDYALDFIRYVALINIQTELDLHGPAAIYSLRKELERCLSTMVYEMCKVRW